VRQRGSAGVDYLAAVAVVGVTFAGLVAVRPHHVDRDAPVNAISPIVRLLGRPVDSLAPRPRRPPRPSGQPTPRPRPKPPPDESATVLLPEWWRGP